ncbi:MAG: hypothetical protein ACPG77_04840 [Nannocystaceae bacterium]
MPGPNSSDPLTPRELDILEDAVEAITEGQDWLWPEDIGPHVRQRLTAYRQILAAYHEIALEPVPSGLLDPVLQQLKQLPRERVSWFRALLIRLRRSQIALPTLTVVATATLVLWMVEPSVHQDEVGVAPEPSPAALENLQIQPMLPAPTSAEAKPGAAGTATSTVIEESPNQAEREKSRPVARKAAKKSKRAVTHAQDTLAEDAEMMDAQAPRPAADKDVLRSELERADGLRRKGACTQASTIYRELAAQAKGTQGARALAGLSLCAEFEGQQAGAEQYMQQARAITAIDAWAAREREAMGSSKLKAAKSLD